MPSLDTSERLRSFLSIRKRSLRTRPAESYLLTLFLAAQLFLNDESVKEEFSEEEFASEVTDWISEVRDVVVQGVMGSLVDHSLLIQEEERIQKLFSHFDQFIR